MATQRKHPDEDHRPGVKKNKQEEEVEEKKTSAVPECFQGKSFYEILGVAKDASVEEITKAYRRLSLKHHPDRNTSPTATEEFQYLARIHETLAKDPRKRAMYDKHGDLIVQDMSEEFMDAYQYWREVFPELQADDVEAYKASYIGSEEEKQDVIDAWDEFKGDMFLMMRDKIFFATSESADRLTTLVRSLIDEGKVNKKFVPNFEKSLKTLKQKLKEFEEQEAQALENQDKVKSAEAAMQQLVELLKSNKQSRESFFEAFQAKYGGSASEGGKASTGKKKKVSVKGGAKKAAAASSGSSKKATSAKGGNK